MDGKKIYSAFNGSILIVLILIAFALAFIALLPKAEIFSQNDEYGCNKSAGFVWSKARNSCVKVYEEAVVLNSVNGGLNAFIIFSKDNKTADIFLPNKINLFINVIKENHLWQTDNATYKLINDDKQLSLTENDKEIYIVNK